MSTGSLSRQSLCKILAHSYFFETLRAQTSSNVVHATGGEDRTLRTRATDAHFLVFQHM